MKLSSKTLEAASSKMASVVFNKKLDRIYEQRMKLISELVKKYIPQEVLDCASKYPKFFYLKNYINLSDNLKNRIKLPSSNTSGILGVRYRSDRGKWYAEIQVNNRKICLGSYTNKEDAIRARLEAEIKYFGEYKSKVLNNEIN